MASGCSSPPSRSPAPSRSDSSATATHCRTCNAWPSTRAKRCRSSSYEAAPETWCSRGASRRPPATAEAARKQPRGVRTPRVLSQTKVMPLLDAREGFARNRRATPPAYPRATVHRGAAHKRQVVADESQAWLDALQGPPAVRDAAIAELHAMLIRGARHELARRKDTLAPLSGDDLRDLATQAADDALVAILAKLDTFRGASRFTTWAYKFVLLEAGVKARRRAWQGREV